MRSWMFVMLFIVAIIPFVLRADVVDKLLFSNKGYAKQIEVKTYILTQEQVAELFKEPNKEPIQLTVEELNKNDKNCFVVRVKNLGERHAWGVLSCTARTINKPFKIPIISIKNQFCDSVLSIIGVVIAETENSPYPDISYKWSELYTK